MKKSRNIFLESSNLRFQLYIAQAKRKCDIDLRDHYNISKKENQKVPQCPPEKEEAIMDALKHFQMI